MATTLDGRKLGEETARKLKKKVSKLRIKPKLIIIQVGSIPESDTYIKRKVIFGEKIGARVEHKKFGKTTKRVALIKAIERSNEDKSVHGIIVQEPLPKHLENISEHIAEEKRVDGGKYFLPATTRGILALLDHYHISVPGKRVVIVGRSKLVGIPTALALLARDATVVACHSKTRNLEEETKRADILVVAAGKPKLIGAKHVSKNQCVIDVGINLLDKKLTGDVDFAKVSKIVRFISPVPGGVGPMTVASLFENLLDAHKLQAK